MKLWKPWDNHLFCPKSWEGLLLIRKSVKIVLTGQCYSQEWFEKCGLPEIWSIYPYWCKLSAWWWLSGRWQIPKRGTLYHTQCRHPQSPEPPGVSGAVREGRLVGGCQCLPLWKVQQEGILFICFLISVHVVGCWENREINVTISRSMQDVTVIL